MCIIREILVRFDKKYTGPAVVKGEDTPPPETEKIVVENGVIS